MKIRNGSHPKLNRLPASLACGRASRLGTPTNPALYVYLWLDFVVISDNWWKVWIRSMLKIRDGSPLGSFPIRSVGGAGLTLTGCNNLCSKMSTQYSREHLAQSTLQRAPSTQVTPSTEYSSCNNLCSKTLWWAHQPPKYGRARIREAVDVQLLISRFHPKVFDHRSLPDRTTATWSPIITFFSQPVPKLCGKGEKQGANIKKQLAPGPREDGAYGVRWPK